MNSAISAGLEMIRKENQGRFCTILLRCLEPWSKSRQMLNHSHIFSKRYQKGKLRMHSLAILIIKTINNRPPRRGDELLGRHALSLITNIATPHGGHVLHRYIKPSNISWDGRTLLIADFGHVQKIEKVRRLTDTEGLTAPEIEIHWEINSRKTDEYSVGATLNWFFQKR